MELLVIGQNGIGERVKEDEVEKYKQLPEAMRSVYIELRQRLDRWGIDNGETNKGVS